jgi:ABC-type polar amino acid transport system ATPase subunit
MRTDKPIPIIGVVGPCTSGKSTLIRNLHLRGIKARHVAQEHSFVANMWQRLTNPDVLVFLDVSYSASSTRKNLNWNLDDYQEQHRRLRHAQENADYYLLTDSYNEQEVCQLVLTFLQKHFPLLTPPQ